MDVFDVVRQQTATNRAPFFYDFTLPVFGCNRAGTGVREAARLNGWHQGMMGSALAKTLVIEAFSETDFTADLKAITVPTLVLHGEDDQGVPLATTGKLSAGLVVMAKLIACPSYRHGMPVTQAARINGDLLAFVVD